MKKTMLRFVALPAVAAALALTACSTGGPLAKASEVVTSAATASTSASLSETAAPLVIQATAAVLRSSEVDQKYRADTTVTVRYDGSDTLVQPALIVYPPHGVRVIGTYNGTASLHGLSRCQTVEPPKPGAESGFACDADLAPGATVSGTFVLQLDGTQLPAPQEQGTAMLVHGTTQPRQSASATFAVTQQP